MIGGGEGQNEAGLDVGQSTLHLIFAFVKGMTVGPNSAHETADSPQLFCSQARRPGRELQRQPSSGSDGMTLAHMSGEQI